MPGRCEAARVGGSRPANDAARIARKCVATRLYRSSLSVAALAGISKIRFQMTCFADCAYAARQLRVQRKRRFARRTLTAPLPELEDGQRNGTQAAPGVFADP
jgi:hypothetical protein